MILLVVVRYYEFCLEDTSTLGKYIVGHWCESVDPAHNVGYCNRNLYDCISDDYVKPARYSKGTWYYPPPTDNDFPPEPNTYGSRVMPDDQGEVCYDFALHRTIDEEYCDDIGEDTGSDNNLIEELGFPYCPPRVMCVNADTLEGLAVTELEPPAAVIVDDNQSIIPIENEEMATEESTTEAAAEATEEESTTTSPLAAEEATSAAQGEESEE